MTEPSCDRPFSVTVFTGADEGVADAGKIGGGGVAENGVERVGGRLLDRVRQLIDHVLNRCADAAVNIVQRSGAELGDGVGPEEPGVC